MKRSTLVSLVLLAAFGTSDAWADFWQSVWRGLDYAVTPTGSPVFTTGDGTRVNGARTGRLRIVPTGVVGSGYRLEFDRSFGRDSRGRPEVLRFGPGAELSLSGVTQMTAGYTEYRGFRAGTLDVFANDLQYDLRTKIGLQDAQLTGTLSIFNQFEINELGFYTLTMNASNTDSELTVDGVVVRDEDETNFDLGPVSVKGNLYFDVALALLTSFGADVSGLESIFPDSPIDQINDAIAAEMQESGVVAGETVAADPATLLLQTVVAGDESAVDPLMEQLVAGADVAPGASEHSVPATVPEPGTLMLVALGGSTLWYWRRRN